MIWENFKLAFASIRSAKLRSFLTMLGIIIGIAAVVSISAIGEGLKKSVDNQIAGLGANIISITSGKVISTDKGGKRTLSPTASIGASTLTQSDLDSVSHASHIKGVAPIMLISGKVNHGDNVVSQSYVVATTPAFNQIRQQKLKFGRFLEDGDYNSNVVVLGSGAAEELFGTDNASGQTILVRGTEFKIIGELEQSDNGASSLGGGGGFDSILYLPVGAAKTLTGDNLQILRILAQSDDSKDIQASVDSLKTILLKNHGGQEDFSTLTQKDIIDTAGTILNGLETAIAAIAAIALLVGGIGIMNIMLVSVTERTREIGIRKALGASSRIVLTQFLIEAVVISLLGGLLGIAAAYGQATLAGHLIKIPPVFTSQIIMLATGVSIAIGVIFGMAPAIKAARKRPIEALRYE